MKARKINWKEGKDDSLVGHISGSSLVFCVIDKHKGKFVVRSFTNGTVQFYEGYSTLAIAKSVATKKLKKHVKELQEKLLLYATSE